MCSIPVSSICLFLVEDFSSLSFSTEFFSLLKRLWYEPSAKFPPIPFDDGELTALCKLPKNWEDWRGNAAGAVVGFAGGKGCGGGSRGMRAG